MKLRPHNNRLDQMANKLGAFLKGGCPCASFISLGHMKNMKYKIILAMAIFIGSVGVSFGLDLGIETEKNIEQFISFGNKLFEKAVSSPEKEIIEKIPNKHNPNQIDEWHTLYNDGLMVRFYRAKSAPKDLLNKIILTGNRISLPFGIQLGDKKGGILQRFGKPDEDKGNELYYNRGSSAYEESVTFRLSDGVLTEIIWNYEMD